MSRIYMIDGVSNGYHDILNRNPPDPVDPTGIQILALCLLQQANCTVPATGSEENGGYDLEAFEVNGLGIFIKMNGQEFFLKSKKLKNEDQLFCPRKK